MNNAIPIEEARRLLLEKVRPAGTETIPLEACPGRVLARSVTARQMVPPFDRSPFDGYAFRSADSGEAGRETPVTLRVLEEVAAGDLPRFPVTPGTAVRIMTGAPIPPGADAVEMYEKTKFAGDAVTLFSAYSPGENIVRAGEDVRLGDVLAEAGSPIDAWTLGTLAGQGLSALEVYRRPRVGLISTGSELLEPGQAPAAGKIYNSNRYTFAALLEEAGCTPVYLGSAGDSTEAIAALIRTGAETCDGIMLTGGVSVGDFDLTPKAMEACGAEVFFRKVDMKPGKSCCYGRVGEKPVCGLSGNPAAAVTNFYALALPALRRLRGCRDGLPREVTVRLLSGFPKRSPNTRLLRGRLVLTDGEVRMELPQNQGNGVLSSAMGCDVMAVVPGGSGPLEAGTKLKGFLVK